MVISYRTFTIYEKFHAKRIQKGPCTFSSMSGRASSSEYVICRNQLVRHRNRFSIYMLLMRCAFSDADVPLAELLPHPMDVLDSLSLSPSLYTSDDSPPRTNNALVDLVLICRQGNDSQIAVSALLSVMQNPEQIEISRKIAIRDVRGGLYGWHRDVDPHFPVY